MDDIKTNMHNIPTLGATPTLPSLNTEFTLKFEKDSHTNANQPNNHNQMRNPHELFGNRTISKPTIINKIYAAAPTITRIGTITTFPRLNNTVKQRQCSNSSRIYHKEWVNTIRNYLLVCFTWFVHIYLYAKFAYNILYIDHRNSQY